MDAPILAALIAATASIAVALWTVTWTVRENKKTRELQAALRREQQHAMRDLEELKRNWTQTDKKDEHKSAARAELDRYLEPLLDAAFDLADRIKNIQQYSFFSYLGTPRERVALLSTLYRFARYFAWVEIRQLNVRRLRLERDESMGLIDDTLSEIVKTFATDQYDRMDDQDFATSRFMIWWEEQRAIGELMRSQGEALDCIGFDTFVDRYETHYRKWFETFADDLKSDAATQSLRLERLQGLLDKLLCATGH